MSKRQEDLYFIRIMDGGGRPKDWRTSQKPENYNICGLRKGQSLASTENKEAQIKKKVQDKMMLRCRLQAVNNERWRLDLLIITTTLLCFNKCSE